MPVHVPPSPRSPVRPVGDPGAARAWASALLRSGSLLDDRSDWVGREAVALVGAEGGWSGPSADAYAAWVAYPGRKLGTTGAVLRSVATAVDAYADDLESAQRRADDLTDVCRTLVLERADLLADTASTDADTSPQVVAELQRRAADLGRDIALHGAASDAAAAAGATAEAGLIVALRRFPSIGVADAWLTATGQDPALESALAKGGVSLTTLPGIAPDAAAAWWSGLTDAERDALLVECPDVIGHLDGIPADVRDTANRTLVDRDIAMLEAREERGELAPSERSALENARAVRDQIGVIEGRDDYYTHKPIVAQLYDYQPFRFGGDGRALLSVGDLGDADNVAFTVPGMTTTVADSMGGNVDDALNLYTEARWADRAETTACMVWIGYDAPSDWDLAGVGNDGRAREGGALLAADVAGFQASRGADQPNLTVVGHSYGSTTTAHAATDVGLDVDSIALIGSPGAGSNVDSAADLGIGAENVWVGADPLDPVTWLGSHGWLNAENLPGNIGLGNDPAEDDFGAQRFQASDSDFHVNTLDYHTSYYQEGTESLFNLAALVTGNEDEVLLAEHRTDPLWSPAYDPEAFEHADERTHE